MKDYSSIVVESKIKLLRNLVGFEFPSVLSGDEGIKVLNKLADTILKLDSSYKIYKMKTLSELDVNVMKEKKLVTSRLLDAEGYGAVVLSGDEKVSIMLNESDHIIEQYTLPGLSLIAAYEQINQIDNQILSKLDIAFDDCLGFLTSSIADIGTGLRASITLFLPALTLLGKIDDITARLHSQGIDFKIVSDDDMQTQAYTYSLTNIKTIGVKENDIIIRVTELAIKLSEMEIKARNELLTIRYVDDAKDKVFRAWGILTNCFKVSVDESQQLLGDLKMGIALDLIRFKDVSFLDKLMIDVQPYSLTKISGSSVTDSELDKYRATFISNVLKSKRIK